MKRTIGFILLMSAMCAVAFLSGGCKGGSGSSRMGVSGSLTVGVYEVEEKNGSYDTVSPCLLEERVSVSELIRYSGEDNKITMPFKFSDTEKYAEITESNLGERIAISVNGKVVSVPVVKARLDDGACSVVLSEKEVTELFPSVDPEDFK